MNKIRAAMYCFIACLGLLPLAAIAAEPAKDPIIGEWVWMGKGRTIIRDDGTANKDGEWRFLENKEIERKYEIVWKYPNRIWIDKLTLSRDGKNLEGKNQQGNRVWGEKILPPK